MTYLHYSVDGETPLCGWHKAHVGEPYSITKKLSMTLCDKLQKDLCDLCLYVKWRMESHADILDGMPKCQAGITLWSDEEGVRISCDVPQLFHENIPEDKHIHWDFHMGYWLGHDQDSMVFI